MACRLLLALRAGLRELVAHDVEAAQLVEHGDHERLVVRAEVYEAVARDERGPGLGGVEVVAEAAVEGEGDGLALDVPYAA